MSKMNLALAETENNAVAVRGSTVDPFAGLCGCRRAAEHPRLTDEVLEGRLHRWRGRQVDPDRHDSSPPTSMSSWLAGSSGKEGKPVEHFMVRVADGVQPMQPR